MFCMHIPNINFKKAFQSLAAPPAAPGAAPVAAPPPAAPVHAAYAESDEAFLTRLYQQELGRAPDPGGFQSNLQALRGGVPRDAMLQAFRNSDEYKQKHLGFHPLTGLGNLCKAIYNTVASWFTGVMPAPGTPGTQPTRGMTPPIPGTIQVPAVNAYGDAIDLRSVNFNGAMSIADWQVTSRLTNVNVDRSRDTVTTEHTKAGQWPTHDFFGDANAPVEGNQWFFANINGQWYGGAGNWLRPGQTVKGTNVDNIGPDQFYNGRDPLKSWRPRSGEMVGIAVSMPARAGQWTGTERSNIVMVRWP